MALIISTAAHVASGRCKIFLSYDSISAIFSDLIWLEALIASCVMCRFEFGILPAHIWSLRQFQIIWFREFESDRKLESLQWYSIHWKRGGNYVEIEKFISRFLNYILIALPPVCGAPTMPLPTYCLQNTFKIAFNIAFKIAFNMECNIAVRLHSILHRRMY